MVDNWVELELWEAGVQLFDCEHKTPPASRTGYPYVAIPQMRDGRIVEDDIRRITPQHFSEWTRKTKPQGWDVIVSRRCNPGETAFVPPGFECALGQNLVILRSDGKTVYPPFLRWLLRGPAWWEQVRKHINVGAVFDSLKCADILHFRLPIPPLVEQRAIAHILVSLDDKIELNRRMSKTLEHIAQAIFKSWFIDFDPVKAKMDGREPYGLKPEIADLFPSRLVQSVLGPIPEGWQVVPLDQIADFLNGLALGKYPPKAERYLRVIKIAELRNGFTESSDKVSADIPDEYVVKDSDVLFSWSGSLEVVIWYGGKGALNQHIFKVSSPRFPKWYYYYFIKAHLEEFRRIAADKATTMGHIQRKHLSEALCVYPTLDVMEAADKVISPLLERAGLAQMESRTLAQIRDTLLPKLISGEIRVSDAERFLEVNT